MNRSYPHLTYRLYPNLTDQAQSNLMERVWSHLTDYVHFAELPCKGLRRNSFREERGVRK